VSAALEAPAKIAVGDALPVFELNVTSTVIVAGAIASRDFMPVHHDADYARAKGSPHMFMNILTTNGYLARYITDWAGPETIVKNIKVRLGAPAIPDKVLRFTGEVLSVEEEGEERLVEVSVRAANELGDHATGTVLVSLPA
jgi:acyl dehydratase